MNWIIRTPKKLKYQLIMQHPLILNKTYTLLIYKDVIKYIVSLSHYLARAPRNINTIIKKLHIKDEAENLYFIWRNLECRYNQNSMFLILLSHFFIWIFRLIDYLSLLYLYVFRLFYLLRFNKLGPVFCPSIFESLVSSSLIQKDLIFGVGS